MTAPANGSEAEAENTPRAAVLFVTRDTVVHTFHGSIAAVRNLLTVLQRNGVPVTVLMTGAASRSPRLFFRERLPLPDGVALLAPGYLRLGRWFLLPFSLRAWARFALRAASRVPGAERALLRILQGAGVDVFDRTWDLTEPTARETALVERTVQRMQPRALIANYAFWAPVLRTVRDRRTGGKPRTMILMHDMLAEHVRLFTESGLPPDCNPITPAMETDWLNSADTVLAIQQEEAAAVRSRVQAEVLVQPISMAVEAASAAPEPLRCLFVGSNSPPNVQGLLWMMEEVWPRVLREEPDAVLAAAGSVCDRVGAAPRGVQLLGHVESLAEQHRRAAVCAVPLQVGSGLKIKLLDALSYGKATVSTTVGVQGVEAWVADAVAVADDPDEFAAAIVRILRDPAERQRRERAATAVMQEHFSAGSAEERALLARL